MNHHLRKRKRIRIGKRGNKIIRAAEWVDLEIIENIRLRMRLNKLWRFARKNQTLQIQETCKKEYERQKKITAALINKKKESVGEGKNTRDLERWETILEYDKRITRKE